MGAGCPTTPWSAVASAQANAALAGVLAGFMFGGIVLLLGQRSTSRRLQAMSLMLAAFVVLGLDAYLFGLVTGETAALCRRQWTEAMIAAGLLGVGVVAIVCGLGLLLNSYISVEELTIAAGHGDSGDHTSLDEPARLLRLLTRGLMYGVVVLVVFLLTGLPERRVQHSPAALAGRPRLRLRRAARDRLGRCRSRQARARQVHAEQVHARQARRGQPAGPERCLRAAAGGRCHHRHRLRRARHHPRQPRGQLPGRRLDADAHLGGGRRHRRQLCSCRCPSSSPW